MEQVSDADIKSLIDDKYDGSTENKAMLRRDVARLASGEPLAYVIGWIPFMSLRIYLDSKPLIPRPETEWWVEELAGIVSKRSGPLRALDLCAGSGAIGCAILNSTSGNGSAVSSHRSRPLGQDLVSRPGAAIPLAHVSFGEIDPAHEATIRKNIEENHLDAGRADVRVGDLFSPFADERFDIIATNPPYIPEKRVLPGSVANFEPSVALRAGNDGLDVIRRIARAASDHMNPGGELWLECDSEHAEAARELIAAGADKAGLRTDQYGRPRLIVGYY